MMQKFERQLSRIPMYILVFSSLCALIVVALVVPIFTAMPYTPVALLVSTLVFTSVSVGASFGIGKLFKSPSHLPSALITALILTVLFTPTLNIATLGLFALVAIVSQASKYLVVYRRRHLFNPAAFAVFAIGLTGLAHASWWVGSPVMAPFVALTAVLVLYKTRQLLLGGVFLAISLILLLATGTSMGAALFSWPLLFLAGFMLSEPLTLPPHRWQKRVVAAAVAAITSLPFSIGLFHSSPESALLAGNLLAFILAFRQRTGIHLTLRGSTELTPHSREFTFTSPVPVQFVPGQYIELSLVGGRTDARGFRRMFTIASAPGQRELRLGIKFYKRSSTFKQALRALPKGTQVQVTGISGDFILPKDPSVKLLFVAGGIGITPFISYLRAGQLVGRDATLLYYVPRPSEAAYKQELDAHAGLTVHYFAAQDEGGDFTRSRRPDSYVLNTLVPDLHERHAYISGPPAMVASVKQLLRARAKRIHTDYFSGY